MAVKASLIASKVSFSATLLLSRSQDENRRLGIAATGVLQDSQRHFVQDKAERSRTSSQNGMRAECRLGASSATTGPSGHSRKGRRDTEAVSSRCLQHHRRKPNDRLGDHRVTPDR